MPFCKHRPQRTYCAQYIIELDDMRGLVKHLGEHADCDFHAGAWLAFGILAEMAEEAGEVDRWQDFAVEFEARVSRLKEGEA